MSLQLYQNNLSPPCKSVQLTARALGLQLELRDVDVSAGQHMNPEFLKVNPTHTIPTLVDGDFALWESRAIITYLASKYGKNDSLYPKDPKIRVNIDRLLYFDMGTLYRRFAEFAYPVLLAVRKGDSVKPDREKLELVREALQWLDDLLEGHFYAVTNKVTVADHCLVATVSTLEAAGIDVFRYSRVSTWLGRCKLQMAGYKEIIEIPCNEFAKMAKAKLRV